MEGDVALAHSILNAAVATLSKGQPLSRDSGAQVAAALRAHLALQAPEFAGDGRAAEQLTELVSRLIDLALRATCSKVGAELFF